MSEDLPVDEVLEALEEYQRRTIELYHRHAADPEACVKAMVELHLEWTEEDPDRARLVSRYRGPVMAGPGRERLNASNARYFEESKRWMNQARESGMPSLSFNLLHALVFAPTQEIAKHWLGGRLKKQPADYAAILGDAAWAGILAAGDPSAAPDTDRAPDPGAGPAKTNDPEAVR